MLLEFIKKESSFDPNVYLYKYPDVFLAKVDPFQHYIQFGKNEGRDSDLSKAGEILYKTSLPSPGVFNRFSSHLGFSLVEKLLGLHHQILTRNLSFILKSNAWTPILADSGLEIISSGYEIFIIRSGLTKSPANIFIDNKNATEVAVIELDGIFISIYSLCMGLLPYRPKLTIGIEAEDCPRKSIDIKNPFSRVLIITDAQLATDASRVYRCKLKAEQLTRSYIQSIVLSDVEILEQLLSSEINFPAFLSLFSCIIFQRRGLSNTSHEIMRVTKYVKIRLLYDADDLIYNPWRINETAAVRSGLKASGDQSYYESLRSRMRLMLLTDGAILSTQYLKRTARSMGLETYLMRNKIEADVFLLGEMNLRVNRSRSHLRIIYMSGSATHNGDAKIIIPALKELMEENHDKFELTILGEVNESDWSAIPSCNFIKKVSREEMFGILAEHDISLVPLERTLFNLGKSSLKFIEASAVGVVTMASPLYEFKRDISRSGAGKTFKDGSDLKDGLMDYYDNPQKLLLHREMAYKYASELYKIEYINNDFYMWVNNLQ